MPLPGILEVVHALAGRAPLGVISNTRSHLLMLETLEQLGVRQLFGPIITSADCGWRKPSPRIFQKVLDAWQLPTEQIVMIGDSPAKDIAGANALGMRTIWQSIGAPEERAAADTVASRPVQILEILASWGVTS